MDKLFKGRKRKGPKVISSTPSQNVTTSTSTLASTGQHNLIIEGIDWPSEIAGITKSTSEGSSLLVPIQATCALVVRGLELSRDIHHNQSDSEGVVELLKIQMKEMETLAVRLQMGDKKAGPELQLKLGTYLKTIQEALAEVTVATKPPKRKTSDLLHLSRPTTSSNQETPTLKQKLDVSYQLFMDAVLLVTLDMGEEDAFLVANSRETGAATEQTFPEVAIEVDESRDRLSFNLVVQDKRNEVAQNPLLDSPDRDTSKAITSVDVVIEIALILREASEASSILVPLKVVCTVIAKVLQDTRVSKISSHDKLSIDMDEIQEKLVIDINLKSLADYLGAHCRFIEREVEESEKWERKNGQHPPQEEFLNALSTYLKVLDATRIEITSWEQRNQITGVHASIKTAPSSIGGLESELERSFNALLRKVHGEILSGMMRASSGVAMLRLSRLLKGAINARGERVKPLTPGTRLSLIERLSDWGGSRENHEQIFWLHDEAGTGKSTLAAHMAKQWEIQGVLAARFFFDRNGGRNLRRLDRFCVTLAQEISDHHPLAQATYLEVFKKTLSAEELPFSEAFQLLVVTVAEQLSKRLPKPVIFVIDALDECHEDDVQPLISSVLNALPGDSGIRFLFTSRPTKEITSILNGISGVAGKGVVLLDVKHGVAERDHDTSIYVRQTLKGFSTMDQNLVIQCASGVFLWASLACETLLRTITPRKVLEKFQKNTPDRTMQTLYEAALEAALPPDPSSRDLKLLHTVLQGVTLTYAPVSIFSVRTFFPNRKDAMVEGEEFVEFFVKKLGSIMKDGTPSLPIYILHPTFREFMEGQNSGAKFYISPPDGHCSIAFALLALLMEGLTPNVLGLDDGHSPLPLWPPFTLEPYEPPARLSLDIEAPLRYAVAFWATHASLALGEDEMLYRLASQFFSSQLLLWFEWASALQEISGCIEGLRRLQQAIKVQGTSELKNMTEIWCSDSLRFLLRNSHIIERCGLQAWMSALAFTPRHSLVYQTFSQNSIRPLPQLLTHYVEDPDSSRVLWDSKLPLGRSLLSPDGKRLLAFGNARMRLFDVKSLKLIADMKGGHSGVNGAAFSSDGSLIASGAADARVCLWDGFTGSIKEKLPLYGRKEILHVAFTLSDSEIVAVDSNQQIFCWRVAPTEWIDERVRHMQGVMHTEEVGAIALSTDGKILATLSGDKSIKLWSPEHGTAIGGSMIGSADALVGSFSIDGTRLVAGYSDGMVAVWNVNSQSLVHSQKYGTLPVSDIAVSPDGRHFASGGVDLRLWDINTCQVVCSPVEGYVNRLAFNQSGNRLVVASSPHLVTVCDIRSTKMNISINKFTLKGSDSLIRDIAVTPDGGLIVIASLDGLRVWDTDLTDISDNKHAPERVPKEVRLLASSTDGTRLVSAGNAAFQLWDMMNGQKIGDLIESPAGAVQLLIFSSGSSTIWASAHDVKSGGIVCIWEYQSEVTAPSRRTLLCKQGRITSIAFARDDTYMITGGKDHSIKCWDVGSETCTAEYDCGGIPLHFTISNDGNLLALASDKENICIRNLVSNLLIAGPKSVKEGKLRWSTDSVKSITFSPDGRKLVVKHGQALLLFDIEDDMRWYGFFDDPIGRMWNPRRPTEYRPTFSLDGKHLFYLSFVFDLSNVSQDMDLSPADVNETMPSSPVSPLAINSGVGRIYSAHWKDPILAVPANVKVSGWVAHRQTLAFGSSDGRVFIMHFPDELTRRYIDPRKGRE